MVYNSCVVCAIGMNNTLNHATIKDQPEQTLVGNATTQRSPVMAQKHGKTTQNTLAKA